MRFIEVLSTAQASIPFTASAALAGRAPYVFETECSTFDVEDFCKCGHARLRVLDTDHAMISRSWNGAQEPTSKTPECARLEIVWNDTRYEVVRLAWMDAGCSQSRAFILAQSEQAADALFRAVCAHVTQTVNDEILVFEEGQFTKSAELFEAIKSSTFDNLILPHELEASLKDDFSAFFDNRELYDRYRVPWRRGALFVGPPGNGKTHTIKALVGALGKPCLYVKSLLSRCDTDHTAIRRVFERAREMAPCVLVLEDLDSIVNDDNRSFFLNELDGFAENRGVATIATTNHADRLDPALVDRPSRFDRTYAFALPDGPRRLAFLERWSIDLDEDLRPTKDGLARAAEITSGFSFAYLKELGTSCLLAWIRERKSMDDILDVQARTLAGHVRRGNMSNLLR
jgi:AAA+ superfamily predicted ATPase